MRPRFDIGCPGSHACGRRICFGGISFGGANHGIGEFIHPATDSCANSRTKPSEDWAASRGSIQQSGPSSPKGKSVIREPASSSGVASSSKLIAQPSFIVKPGANYPLESQAAREEGMVVLRITVNASGRPIEVRVVGSSGFYRLDRAALEGGWRCRIRNAHAGDQFDAPFRFKIQK